MLELCIPAFEDLWFRKLLLSDAATMSYNHAYGGTIDFSEEKWEDWYDRWVRNTQNDRFYRYIRDPGSKAFIGEAAYHFDGDKYIISIIIYAAYRGNGFGKIGLDLLCEAAKSAGIDRLYDDIAIDNPAMGMFQKAGFTEEYRTDEIVMLKKCL